MTGKTVRGVIGKDLYDNGKDFLNRSLSGEQLKIESTLQSLSGTRHVEIVGIPDTNDGVTNGVYVLTSDVTAAREYEEELSRLARVDPLTGLPNLRSYLERLPEALQRTGRSGRGLALMFLHIDHFKKINDTLGHAGGDEVLQEFARRLKSSVRTTDIVSRLAGDEFTVVLENLTDAKDATLVASKIVSAFHAPVSVGQTSWAVSASVGIAFTRDYKIDVSTLSHEADVALYRAKANGRAQYVLYSANS
jgi:diguanylate cyclase (GGDEF)-like protein